MRLGGIILTAHAVIIEICFSSVVLCAMKPLNYLPSVTKTALAVTFFVWFLLFSQFQGCKSEVEPPKTSPSCDAQCKYGHLSADSLNAIAKSLKIITDSLLQSDKDSNLEKGLELTNSLLEIRQIQKDTERIVGSLYKKGKFFKELYSKKKGIQLDSAKANFKLALTLRPEYSDIINELAHAHALEGDYATAERLLLQSIKLSTDQKENAYASLAYYYLSECFNNQRLYQKGLESASKGLGLGQPDHRGILLLGQGAAELGLKKNIEATLSYQKAIQVIADSANLADAYTNLGIIQKQLVMEQNGLGSFDSAKEWMRKGLSLKSDPEGFAASYNNIADVFLLQNQKDSAYHYYQRAIIELTPGFKNTDWRQNPNEEECDSALIKTDLMGYLRDKATALQTDPALWNFALKTYSLADIVCDTIRKRSEGRESKYFWREEAYPMYWEAVKLCHKQGNSKLAYYFFEKSRSMMLLDAMNGVKLKGTNEWKAVEILSLDKLQGKLESNQALIEYLTPMDGEGHATKDSIYVLVVTKDACKLAHLRCPLDSLAKFVNGAQKTVGSSPGEFHYWYKILIGGLRLPNHIDKLIISPSGDIGKVAFDGLLTGKVMREENFLVSKFTTSIAYSATLQFLDYHWNGGKGILAMAPVEFPSYKMGALESTKEGADWLGQKFSAKVFIQDQATKNTFVQQSKTQKILQLFTHATDSSELNGEPGIYFRDSILSLLELYNLKLNAEMVVLTACQTGSGEHRVGEGIGSLARGFAYAGVPTTVATLWSVPDLASVAITKDFYTNLKAGMAKDEALRKAKISYLQNSSNSTSIDPYYWAAITLFGDTGELDLGEGSNWWKWMGGIGLLTAIAFLVYYLKRRDS